MIRHCYLLAAAALLWECSAAEVSLRWKQREGTVEVAGLPAETLHALSMKPQDWPAWEEVLRVEVQPEDIRQAIKQLPITGRYSIANSKLIFKPLFPFVAGPNYSARFNPRVMGEGAVSASEFIVFQVPAAEGAPTAAVTGIYPSSAVVPENLLKFYVHFSVPMSGGHIYDNIALLDEDGQPVELPFLEIDEELWNRDMTRLTLFLDPGRIKRGVKPLEEIGPSLQEGGSYALVIRSAWQDAAGNPLREEYRKVFRVGAADRQVIDPWKWAIHPPRSGGRDPLRVEFGEPLDHALALRFIQVQDEAGKNVRGKATVSEDEQLWEFEPDDAWSSGTVLLTVQNTLEDLAGNNIGKPFEVDLFERVEKRITSATSRIPIRIQ